MEGVSGGISVARVICVLGMVYTHAWFGVPAADLESSGHEGTRLFIHIVQDFFGRSSVPLLSVISGWLAVESIRRRSYTGFVQSKLRSVVAPMIAWSVIALITLGAFRYLGLYDGVFPVDFWHLLNELTFFRSIGSLNVQGYFLRDLFVIALFFPLIVKAPVSVLFLSAFVAVSAQILDIDIYILVRPEIFLFFVIGVVARRESWNVEPNFRFVLPVVLVVLSTLAFTTSGKMGYVSHPDAVWNSAAVLLHVFVALLFWFASVSLAKTRLKPILLRAEPYIFLLFCSHVLFLRVTGSVFGSVFGRFGDPLFPVYFLLQPFIALAAAVVLGKLLHRIWPALGALLSGGRFRPTKAATT